MSCLSKYEIFQLSLRLLQRHLAKSGVELHVKAILCRLPGGVFSTVSTKTPLQFATDSIKLAKKEGEANKISPFGFTRQLLDFAFL